MAFSKTSQEMVEAEPEIHTGTVSLHALGKLGLADFFQVAIGATEALVHLHATGELHSQLSLANIRVNINLLKQQQQQQHAKCPTNGQTSVNGHPEHLVCIIEKSGSCSSGLLHYDHHHFNNGSATDMDDNSNHTHTTGPDLCFVAPEQTGRMQNRKLDERSDLYSLGIVLYACLTGNLPFLVAGDALELVHAHIARKPDRVDKDNIIPTLLADMVEVLLEKNPEDRYQSAQGLLRDLQEAQSQYVALIQQGKSTHESSLDFELRHHMGFWQLPTGRLYGRDAQVQQLISVMNRVVAKGTLEIVWVRGYSGTGKTALVEQTHPTLRISGKFDQSRRLPYQAIVSAIENLVIWLLKQDEATLNQWKSRLGAAVGQEGRVVTEFVPSMASILGSDQPPIPELAGKEAQNRFLYVMKLFFRGISSQETPLVLFLDDLQWSDSGSLELLQALATDPDNGHFLIVGAYRDNEVTPSHPFVRTMDRIQASKGEATIHTILVENLLSEHVHLMIADTLHTTKQNNISELIDLTYCKTRGNSFFTRQFLQDLHDQGYVKFDWSSESWKWDTSAIQRLTSTDNVVDFMAKKLQRLQSDLLQCLCTAACIGACFKASTVAQERDLSTAQAESLLKGARDEGLVVEEDVSVDRESVFRFVHDRVQQAALSLIPDTERPARHYRIGRCILEQCQNEEEEHEHIFEIVDQLNCGLAFVKSEEEKMHLAKLNLAGAKRGMDSAAYNSSYVYVSTGISLLGSSDKAWGQHHELCLELHTMAADTAYMSAQFEKMDAAILAVLSRAKTFLEKIPCYRIRILSFKARNKLLEAISTGLDVLKELDVEFPEPTQENTGAELGKVLALLAGKSKQDLLQLHQMRDPVKIAALKIIADINSSVYWAKAELFPFIVFKSVELSVLHGNSTVSSFAYGTFGVILSGVVGDMTRAYEFGELGIEVMEQYGAKDWLAQIFTPHFALIVHWSRHVRETFQPLISSIHIGLETGAIEYAMINANIYCIHGYLSGQEMVGLEKEMNDYSALMKSFAQETNYNFNQIYHQAVLNFSGLADDPLKLVGSAYNEIEMLPIHLAAKDNTACFFVYFNKMILNFFFGDYTEAETCRDETKARLSAVLAKLENTSYNFIDSLLSLALSRKSPERKDELLKRVESNQATLRKWSADAPMNFLHKLHLVEAEQARIADNIKAANKFYKKAIAGAREHGFLNDEALANELAAECFLEIGFDEMGKSHLKQAHKAYARWGAIAKCRQLVERYPEHLTVYAEELAHSNDNSQYLDMFSVMKSAAAIQKEISLGKLLKGLMEVLIENAGADQCCVLLAEKEQLFLQAKRDLGSGECSVLQNIELHELEDLPRSIVSYVARVVENVTIDDGPEDETFGRDPYIQKRAPRSILCSPIVLQGKLLAVVYLQNSLVSGAFTEERTALLNMLSGNVAVSIHNALMYDKLEQKVQERTAALEQQHKQVEMEKARSDELLLNILPRQTAEELKNFNKTSARRYENVTVLFSDIVNFTTLSQNMSPEDLVKELDEYFGAMDEILESHGLEKIKTIGDALLAAGGVPVPDPESAVKMIAAAKQMIYFVSGMKHRRAAQGRTYWDIRIGINTGPVVAGVVGIRKFAYDIWGTTVNVAARMEQQSAPNRINISESTFALVKDQVACVHRGKIAAKNLAARDMYFVKPEKRQSNVDFLMRRGSKRREELHELLTEDRNGWSLSAELGALAASDSDDDES